ncbi:MAG: flagellar biosynthetic protein FliR [Rickettsia sp.]|nr:flagellar biosynthetic protein FliR [Rickettsia sp.]
MSELEIILIKFLLILIRVISALVNFPIISNKYLYKKEIVAIAFVLTCVIFPSIEKQLLINSTNPILLTYYAVIEILIGMIISISSKIFSFAIYVVDHFISNQSSLGIASNFDPSQKINISVFSNFFMLNIIVAIFAFDLEHMFILSFINSYQKFPFGMIFHIEDFTKFFVLVLSESFKLVFHISAPFILINLFSLSASAILSRLMPNLQIFFIISPAQILLLIIILLFVVNNSIYKIIEQIRYFLLY